MIGRWFAFIPHTKYYATNIKQISNCLSHIYRIDMNTHACMDGAMYLCIEMHGAMRFYA